MYLRGVAMGLLFSPLSALALTEISRTEMAQASGLMNVIRQVGGSFGVAILQTLLTNASFSIRLFPAPCLTVRRRFSATVSR